MNKYVVSKDIHLPLTYTSLEDVVIKKGEVWEETGEEADGTFAELKVVDIPDDVEYTIEEYDGMEWVSEKHRVWS